KGLYQPDRDQAQQAGYEEIGRQEKNTSTLLHSTQVDQSDQRQYAQTNVERVALQRRHGRDESTNTGRNPYRCGEDIINHERTGRQQSCPVAEIFTGYGVRPSPLRVGDNGLAIGEIHDSEKEDDADGDGPSVSNACHAERYQQGQSGFGTVRSRTQRVKSEYRKAFCRTDSFCFLFFGS